MKKKTITLLLAAALIITLLAIWLINKNEESYLHHKGCAKCEELEDMQVNGSLPYYKGFITITKDSTLQFTEQRSNSTYNLLLCDAQCDNLLRRLIVDNYRFAKRYNDTLRLGIWGLKNETTKSIDVEAFVGGIDRED